VGDRGRLLQVDVKTDSQALSDIIWAGRLPRATIPNRLCGMEVDSMLLQVDAALGWVPFKIHWYNGLSPEAIFWVDHAGLPQAMRLVTSSIARWRWLCSYPPTGRSCAQYRADRRQTADEAHVHSKT